ncbi:MAG: hypothetical protein ACYSQZ_06690 [Planctomycetota bacterium]|jgi:hypothetical protein
MKTETYHVKGTLKRTFSASTITSVRSRQYQVNQEIEVDSLQSAVEAFEVSGWKWVEPPDVSHVTEAAKLERAGQPSLFPLEEVD